MNILRFSAALALAVALPCLAAEKAPLLHARELPVIAAPDFSTPLDATWSIAQVIGLRGESEF